MDVALSNLHAYLRPGGTFVAMLFGGRSLFGLVNRALPHAVGEKIVTWSMGRDERAPVFPAYYDRCTASALGSMLAGWAEVEIRSPYRGAGYFAFSKLLTGAYLRYEDFIERGGHDDWASHYLVTATR